MNKMTFRDPVRMLDAKDNVMTLNRVKKALRLVTNNWQNLPVEDLKILAFKLFEFKQKAKLNNPLEKNQ